MNGSRHLEFLVNKDLINPISPPELEELYAKRASRTLDNTPIDTPVSDIIDGLEQSDDRILLKMSDAKRLASIFEAPELALEAERAIIQVGEQLEAEKAKAKAKAKANEDDLKNEKKDS